MGIKKFNVNNLYKLNCVQIKKRNMQIGTISMLAREKKIDMRDANSVIEKLIKEISGCERSNEWIKNNYKNHEKLGKIEKDVKENYKVKVADVDVNNLIEIYGADKKEKRNIWSSIKKSPKILRSAFRINRNRGGEASGKNVEEEIKEIEQETQNFEELNDTIQNIITGVNINNYSDEGLENKLQENKSEDDNTLYEEEPKEEVNKSEEISDAVSENDTVFSEDEFREFVEDNTKKNNTSKDDTELKLEKTMTKEDIAFKLANTLLSDSNTSKIEEAQNDKRTSEQIEKKHVIREDDINTVIGDSDNAEITDLDAWYFEHELNKYRNMYRPHNEEDNNSEVDIGLKSKESDGLMNDDKSSYTLELGDMGSEFLFSDDDWSKWGIKHDDDSSKLTTEDFSSSDVSTPNNLNKNVELKPPKPPKRVSSLVEKPFRDEVKALAGLAEVYDIDSIPNKSQVIVDEKTNKQLPADEEKVLRELLESLSMSNNNQQKAKPIVAVCHSRESEKDVRCKEPSFNIGNNNFILPSDFTVEFSRDLETGVDIRTIKDGNKKIIGSVASIDNQVISAQFKDVNIRLDVDGKTRALSSDSKLSLSYDFGEKMMTYEATDTKTPEQSFKMDVRDYRNSIPRTKRNPGVNAMKYDTGTYGDSPYRRKAISDSYISKQRNAYRKTAINKGSRG